MDSLEQVSIWRSLGWAEAQEVAQAWWGQEIQMTCKFATRRDFVFMSPEVIAHLRQVKVSYDFPDHATVIAGLQLPQGFAALQSWPLLSEIPWADVDRNSWIEQSVPDPKANVDSSSWIREFSRNFENSIDGHVQGTPAKRLPRRCEGRAARTQPASVEVPAIPPKPHRPGEEALRNDCLSLEVKRWYQQLCRLPAGRLHHAAVACRLHLWQTIKNSSGFVGGFVNWWPTRQVKHPFSPPAFPVALPPSDVVQIIFQNYRDNFRRFEAWSRRQRSAISKARHAQQKDLIYRDLKEPRPALVLTHTYAILATDDATRSVHVDEPVDCRGHCTWSCASHTL